MFRTLLVLGLLTGCTHRELQYRPTGAELASLTSAAEGFAQNAERLELEEIAARLDVDGRKALLVFGASLAYEKRERIKAAVDQVNAAVVLAIMFEVLGAWDGVQANASIDDSVTRASQAINAQLEKDFGLSGDRLLEGKPDVLSAFASQLKETRAQSARRLVGSLSSQTLSGCHSVGLIVSYDLRLLRFTSWEHADLSRTFAAWKKRARSLHLAELVCDQRAGLLLLSTEDGHPGPRIVGWRFSTADEHARLTSRLRAALGPSPGLDHR
ncbi:MAG: hypothetical protein Q8N23_09095 [Archangium sp.]|nr:hypothetical protein [Archangium sp.]MDP3152814.1 hypothetical protein [Archangium sp.]MDP3571730.1 hypothetical protein [Archangium sp.]